MKNKKDGRITILIEPALKDKFIIALDGRSMTSALLKFIKKYIEDNKKYAKH
tara:strand:+ start:670 stop:825 length:156 start_codon:yes stop_codon:yes gene_type:complete